MNAADRVIRWSTALAVVGVAEVAAVVSYEHACDLVRGAWRVRLDRAPHSLTVDGLIYASSMVMLDSARRGGCVPALARWLLDLGIIATLAANIAHGLGHGIIGAAVAAWLAVALVGSYELLMMVIRSAQAERFTGLGGVGQELRAVSLPLADSGQSDDRNTAHHVDRPAHQPLVSEAGLWRFVVTRSCSSSHDRVRGP
jgi:hypothetical protein